MQLDRRLLEAMPKIMPGIANDALVQDLSSIQHGYEELLAEGPPSFALYTLDNVRFKIADTENFIARAHDSMNHVDEAASFYRQAAQHYQEVGATEQAERSRASLGRLQFAADADINVELQRLQAELDRAEVNTLAHVQALVELGELCCKTGNDFEAEQHLQSALEELKECGGDPSGINLADALSQTLQSIAQGTAKPGVTPIEQKVLVRGLYRRIYLALGQIYKDTDPNKAAECLAKAKDRDSQATNEEFSRRMLDALAGDLGKLI
jgi:tetratricopeptide (TPR) repeat protein